MAVAYSLGLRESCSPLSLHFPYVLLQGDKRFFLEIKTAPKTGKALKKALTPYEAWMKQTKLKKIKAPLHQHRLLQLEQKFVRHLKRMIPSSILFTLFPVFHLLRARFRLLDAFQSPLLLFADAFFPLFRRRMRSRSV